MEATMSQGSFFSQLPIWKAKFHLGPELPFSELLTQERINRLLTELGCTYRERIYTPPVTLWMFLSQVLDDDPSCRATMARLLAYRTARQLPACSTESGSYCEARQRLPEELIRRLALETGQELVENAPRPWHWHDREVKIVDGTVVSMPDTPANTEAFGKPSNQKGRCGFPMMRVLVVLCLVTGALREAATGPYRGKQTGELSLFRSLRETFKKGDIALADRLFCTYCDIAQLVNQEVDGVFRINAQRKVDFRRGLRLGPDDHIVTWYKPTSCPAWITPAEFSALQPTMEVREIRIRVAIPGFRVKQMVVVTTLLDHVKYTKAELAALYRQRWFGEVDLRSLKCTLQMDVLRCKTPEMVRKELWMHFLANNLIRSAMCAAASEQNVLPRQISFRGTQQVITSFYTLLTTCPLDQLPSVCQTAINAIAEHRVGDRPNRYEPRKRKRAPKPYPSLKLSRKEERKLCRKRGSA
jgi:hypothetical protein